MKLVNFLIAIFHVHASNFGSNVGSSCTEKYTSFKTIDIRLQRRWCLKW